MNTQRSLRTDQRGFTLIEVILCLLIISLTFIPLMACIGGATESVLDTINRRKLRYLAQIIVSDIELGKISPKDEEERYEEGSSDDFDGWASTDLPDEYAGFRYVVEVLRDEVIVGGEDEEALLEAGFEKDADGRIVGRPVNNDNPVPGSGGEGGLGGEEIPEKPPGQMKRLLVVSIDRLGEDADDDLHLKIMTYLPAPDEETPASGAEALPGGAVGEEQPGANGQPQGGGAAPPPGRAQGGDRK